MFQSYLNKALSFFQNINSNQDLLSSNDNFIPITSINHVDNVVTNTVKAERVKTDTSNVDVQKDVNTNEYPKFS